ncbi:hypothetical protein K2173_016600 [Erythroxylum novogranatense]|uniref:Dof zinc finger protein n=1 Tax=Erythroxylum novogranatense TaxID=1862640 RepID=A0AAV8SGR1_9ROSI|nr:hypothetical protein K2173_016600 [Erythroxylum novogranatense]
MDLSSAQNQQEMSAHSFENILVCSKARQQERKPRPQPEQALKCPRCDSTNTKFCYYNNYSLSQPRYFCKSCRRYWTKGGTLRNVPVGGGCRKNKRSSSASSKRSSQEQQLTPNSNDPLSTLPSLAYDSNHLTLAFARLQKQSSGQLGFDHDHDHLSLLGHPTSDIIGNPSIHNSAATPAFIDALRSGFLDVQNTNFQNLYYGYGSGNMGEVENSGVCVSGEMGLPYVDMSGATTSAVTVTTMKQELCSSGREDENKVLWGFPWQVNGNGNLGDLDTATGRGSWNALGSTWHGLINSPLM